MSNQPFHNKWHSFNHYTVPLSDYPDSATDPVAGELFPFFGTFYNSFPLLDKNTLTNISLDFPGIGYLNPVGVAFVPANNTSTIFEQPVVTFDIDSQNQSLTNPKIINGGRFSGEVAIQVTPDPLDNISLAATFSLTASNLLLESNSDHWAYSYNLTRSNSADWSLYPKVESTTTNLSSNWSSGFEGYTHLKSNRSTYESFYNTVSSLSSEKNYTGRGGDGWQIALSSITWRTNVSAVNTHQKVLTPYRLVENTTNRTVAWDLTAAQTAYFLVTSDYVVAIDSIKNPSFGGKYTLWLQIDKCPGDAMGVIFNPSVFNIKVKTNTSEYQNTSNSVSLSRNTITKIDFVYDGARMLGRSTFYILDVLTTDDIYYQGTGISMRDPVSRRIKSPVFVNDYGPNIPSSRYIDKRPPVLNNFINRFDNPGLNISYVTLTEYPAVTSLYIAGSGIRIKFFESNLYYFSYQLYNASWPTELSISKFSYLSGSFDRVIGSLSGNSNWQNFRYGRNLIVSPDRSTAPNSVKNSLPVQYYDLQTANIVPVSACTRFYNITAFSAKDKLIRSISVNGVTVSKNPLNFNNGLQQYNFLNEETSVFTFEKIQDDYDIVINYGFQPGKFLKNNYLWFNPGDNTLLFGLGNNLPSITVPVRPCPTIYSNSDNSDIYLKGPGEPINPFLTPQIVLSGGHRYIRFSPDRYFTSSTNLTGLSSSGIFFKSFTAFTVFKVLNTGVLPVSSTIWWLGEFSRDKQSNRGYGLYVDRNLNLFTRNESDKNNVITLGTIQRNKTYVISQKITNKGSALEFASVDNNVNINNKVVTCTTNLSNCNLYFNYNLVNGSDRGIFHLYDYYIFDRDLSLSEIRRMNLFLMDKASKY